MDEKEVLLSLANLYLKLIRKRREKTKNSRRNQLVKEIFKKRGTKGIYHTLALD